MFELSRVGLPLVLMLAAVAALTACTSVALPPPGSGPPTLGPIAATKLTGAPVKGDVANFAFAKVTGGPGDLLTVLNDSLNKEAKARKLNIVPEGDPAMTYKVKSYFSAVGGPTGTLLVYTLDVLDTKGVRIHRISGQEKGGGATSDPWAGIKDSAAETAARHAIDDLSAWVHRT